MQKSYVIRASKVEDAATIVKVRADAFREEVKLYGHGPNNNDSIVDEENFICNIDNNNFSFVIMDNNKIIGGMGGINEGDGKYYLGCIYVSLDYQNKGIGKLLLQHLDKSFPDAKQWHLETPHLSINNHHFYEKNGFVKVGETEPREDGFYLFQYEKKL